METPTVQRRGTKPAETRRAEILAAAVELFHERGYDATTVQHIATAAGVAAGTVYLYFSSKEAVLHALHADFHAGIETAMQTAFDSVWQHVEAGDLSVEGPMERMVGPLVDSVVTFLRERPTETAVMYRYLPRVHHDAEDEDDRTAGYIAAAIEFGIERGRVQVSDPEMAGLLIASALGRPLLRMVVEGKPEDVDRLAAQAKELFIKAVAPTD